MAIIISIKTLVFSHASFLGVLVRSRVKLAFCKHFANELLRMSEYGTGLADTTSSATLNIARHDRIGPLSLTRKTPNFKGEGRERVINKDFVKNIPLSLNRSAELTTKSFPIGARGL